MLSEKSKKLLLKQFSKKHFAQGEVSYYTASRVPDGKWRLGKKIEPFSQEYDNAMLDIMNKYLDDREHAILSIQVQASNY